MVHRQALHRQPRRAAGDAFIAWPGYARDGRAFVNGALNMGAATCLVEDEGVDAFKFTDARVASLPGLKGRTGEIAASYFEHPTATLSVIAITGTNGKTSSKLVGGAGLQPAPGTAAAWSARWASASLKPGPRPRSRRPARLHWPHHARPDAPASRLLPACATPALRPARSRPPASASLKAG